MPPKATAMLGPCVFLWANSSLCPTEWVLAGHPRSQAWDLPLSNWGVLSGKSYKGAREAGKLREETAKVRIQLMSWGSSDAQTALQNCPPHLPMRQRSCLLYLLLDVERSLVGGGNIPAKLAPSSWAQFSEEKCSCQPLVATLTWIAGWVHWPVKGIWLRHQKYLLQWLQWLVCWGHLYALWQGREAFWGTVPPESYGMGEGQF